MMKLKRLLPLVIFLPNVYAGQISLCDSSKGLELVNQNSFSQAQVEMILKGCDKVSPNDPQVLLLHGLLARRQALNNNNYLPAIEWLEKARTIAPANLTINQELAATYELSNNLTEALSLYKLILSKDDTNRLALLGIARIYRIQKQFDQALPIYQNLLAKAPHDTEALNGIAWIKAAQNDLLAASNLFQESLQIQPGNQEALLGLNAIKQTTAETQKIKEQCNVSVGLILVSKTPPPASEIQAILANCKKNHIDTTETQLLEGLLARHQALTSHDFSEAIIWLQKAMNSAASTDKGPAIELAVTYEWAKQLPKAGAIYDYILAYDPTNRAATLGKGRVLRLEQNYSEAANIYLRLLQNNPRDIDAINGLGWIEFSQKNFSKAKDYFNQTLAIQLTNTEALQALNQIRAAQLTPPVYSPCALDNGLKLVNSKTPPVADIEAILQQCENAHFEDTNVALLRGLLARHQARATKNYQQAIFWLQRAMQSAANINKTPALELALTYEQAGQQKEANTIYQQILRQEPDNKAALLGSARILRANNKPQQAQLIYTYLLSKNPNDTDALNGMGWIELAKNNLPRSIHFFESSLKIMPTNEEAKIALKKITYLKTHPTVAAKPLCDANQALILLNQTKPDWMAINKILFQCDKKMPSDTTTLMLHGLLARYQAKKSNDYKEAIAWLKLAAQSASPDNKMPLFELAVTYEWASQPQKALVIYQQLLFRQPDNLTALLGQARVLRALYLIKPSVAVYEKILKTNPNNVEALNGLGESKFTNYELDTARTIFNKVLTIDPQNKDTQRNLSLLNNTTKSILGITQGHYSVPPETSDGTNLFYFRNLNATDALTIYATHNTRQIESGFSSGPTLLPNNSLLLGYQRQIPNQYGWQASYDARQHNSLPFEHRAYGSTNLFLSKNFQWFNALRLAFPSPWNAQLLISGVTAYTPLPFNVTVTGFWAFQQIGGKSESYALDFSKEFSNRLFYDIGPSYLPREKSWEIHGRLILPTFKNQAFVAEYSHYVFNRSTFATAGWRFYWA
ncbi:MAG: tetratricopeptide repeat protein [Legionella sp.]|nr:tetratricopeptide repeat protein [Legionella sp.]